MNLRLLISACLSLSGLAGPLQAAPPATVTELNLMTGREAGTYYQMGRDLKKLASRYHIDLAVIPSAGSLENIFKVYAVYDNLEELGRVGHPKWKNVSVDREALLKAPHLSPCVAQAFK